MTPRLLTHSAAASGAPTLTYGVDLRANLLPLTQLVDEAALDKYSFVRDAHLAQRASLVCSCAPAVPALDVTDMPAAPATGASAPA